jgi:hypothetical protein
MHQHLYHKLPPSLKIVQYELESSFNVYYYVINAPSRQQIRELPPHNITPLQGDQLNTVVTIRAVNLIKKQLIIVHFHFLQNTFVPLFAPLKQI